MLLRKGQRWSFEFKCTHAPSPSRSMHIAASDPAVAHLWVIYPGSERYALSEDIAALPLRELFDFELPAPRRADRATARHRGGSIRWRGLLHRSDAAPFPDARSSRCGARGLSAVESWLQSPVQMRHRW